MKKLFISCPMRERTEEAIKKSMENTVPTKKSQNCGIVELAQIRRNQRMLTDKELLILHDLRDTLAFVHQRDLFDKLLFEYEQYRKCGTPEDCKQREEWMELSLEDIRTNFNSIVKDLRDEVNLIKEQASKPVCKKRERPRKENKYENTEN